MNKTLKPTPWNLKWTPGKVWGFFFALWGLFLSGALAPLGGSPGVVQSVRLQSLLAQKQEQFAKIQESVLGIQDEIHRIETSRITQEREIRRVLGYAAADELVFDFQDGKAL